MKTKFATTLCCLALAALSIPFSLTAQNLSFKAGMNLSNFTPREIPANIRLSRISKVGLFASLNAEFDLNKFLQLETGLAVSSKGYREDYFEFERSTGAFPHDSSYSVNLTYLDIPALAKFYFYKKNMNFYAATGPYFSLALDGNIKTDKFTDEEHISNTQSIAWGSNDSFNSFSRIDYGLLLNLGAELKSFQMGVMYGLGLKDISVHEGLNANKIRNRTWTIYLAYKFFNRPS